MSSTDRKYLTLRLISAAFGWVYILSIPMTLGLVIYAVFFDGPWTYAAIGPFAGVISRRLVNGFDAHAQRVAITAYLTIQGVPQDAANDLWFEAYKEGGTEGVSQLFYLSDELVERFGQL